jgi:hypothetical protein
VTLVSCCQHAAAAVKHSSAVHLASSSPLAVSHSQAQAYHQLLGAAHAQLKHTQLY